MTRVYVNASVVTTTTYSFMHSLANISNNMVWIDVKLNHTFTSVTNTHVFSHDMTTARLNISVLSILIPMNVTSGTWFNLIHTLSNGTF
jgi:hypothetical protein